MFIEILLIGRFVIFFLQGGVLPGLCLGVLEAPMYEAHWMRQLFLDFTFHLKKDIFCFHIQLVHLGRSHGGGDCDDGGGSGEGD